jgi:two-component system sensor histidine kinase TctE
VTGSPSLVRRLLWTLVGSLTAVALVLGAGGAWLIDRIVEGTADRILGASAHAIAETLAVEDGVITLDLPPFALGMLENTARDNVYYSVRRGQTLITGYPDLPFSAQAPGALEEATFRYASYHGARIRIATEARTLPRIREPIFVEVAETLDARSELASRMLVGLALLEAVLVGVAALLVWPAVRWGLRPVTRLRRQIDERPAARADFTPLPVAGVPSELAGLVVGFNDLLRRLEVSVEGMRRFTADASHQMRTPLAILRTHLTLLRKHGTDSEIGKASLDDIQHATDRLQSLLTGLVALARSEEAVGQTHEEIDLGAVAGQVVQEHQAIAKAARVTLHLSANLDEVHAPADPLLLAEIIGNLVDNGIRYNRPGGRVDVIVENAPAPTVAVSDDGPGIPPDQRARVLERFYRLPRDQRLTGSGLGLPIVEALTKRLSASLMLEAGEHGRGLRASVRFPGQRPPA